MKNVFIRVLLLVLILVNVTGLALAKTNTTTTLTSSANPSTYASSVTFTATVSPSAATGTVTFKDGSTTLGTGTLSSGKATYITSALAAGSHSITASYGGNSTYNGSTSSALTQTVNKATSSTTVTSSLNPSGFGTSVTFTATVTPSAATGTVTFKDGSTTLGTGTLSGGKATYSTSTLSVASHSITASYGGDSNDNTSTSTTLTQTVNKATSTTTVTSSLNPSSFGTSVTFTATVTPSAATGTVTFKDGSTTLGTGTLSGGKATYSTSTLSVASHSITASYGGDSNDNTSTSTTLTQTVNKATSTTTVTSSLNPSGFGISVTFTATVTPSAATGTVTFKDGSTALGTGTLSGGKATYSTSTLSIASHSITASYGGDSNDNSSTSSTLTQKVEQASSLALVASANPSPSGSLVTFTATVSPSAATGTVTFYDSSTALGTGTLSGGIATYGTSSLAVGSHSITAVYGGNSTYAGSTSSTLTESVLTVTSIAVTPASISLSVGATLQLVATATYSDGTQGAVTSSVTWSSSDLTIATVTSAGVATGVAEGSATIQATLGTASASATFTGTPSKFRLTGSLNVPRTVATATLLQNGQVLIAGGLGSVSASAGYVGSAELYNPTTGTFSLSGNLLVPRAYHTATLLQNGKVLITGGLGYSNGNYVQPLQAELYDPTTGAFSYTGSLNVSRYSHTATLLQSGKVLIAGGSGDATAELYDPATGLFTYTTGNLAATLSYQAAALLNDGTVLIAGGFSSASVPAELYNPTTQTFSSVGSINPRSENPTATLLSSGKVLIVAGLDPGTGLPVPTAEIYDPIAKTFSYTGSLAHPRNSATSTLLSNGQVLVVGGGDNNYYSLAPAELYDPTSGTFSIAGKLDIARDSHAATLLSDGTVLIAGGEDQYQYQGANVLDYVPQAEIYQSAGQPVAPDSLQITPASASVVIGGTQSFTAVDSNGYPRQDVIWTVSDPSLASVTADESDRGVVTAIAAGQITLTATAETVSGQAQVTISSGTVLAPGTVIWSAPAIPGYSAIQLAQAVPSAGGPDLYSIQLSSDGTKSIIQALTADGQQLWQTPIAAPLTATSVPDGSGGLIVMEYDTCVPGQTVPLTIIDLDPVYGQPTTGVSAAGVQQGNHTVYCYGNGDAPQVAVRGDGAVFVSEPTNNGFPPLTRIENGNYTRYQIPTTSDTENGSQISVQCCMGSPMVNTDGTTYVEYEVRNIVNQVITSDSLYLWWLSADDVDGGTSLLSSTTQNQALLPGSIIPDGNSGVIATWTISPSSGPPPQYPYQAVDVVGGAAGTPYNLPFSPTKVNFGQSPTLVLGENGVAFASGTTTAADGVTQVSQIASFNISSGLPNWTYQSTAGATLSMVAATRGNGIVAKIVSGSQPETVVALDSSGNSSVNAGASVGTLTDYTWWGDWNTSTNGVASGVSAQRAQVANDSPSPTPLGNPSHTGKAGVRCAPLDSQTSTFVEGAFSNLNAFLLTGGACTFCVNHIFMPLNTSQSEFEAYLSQGHEFCDGNKSQEPGSMIGSSYPTVALEFAANVPAPGFEAAATEARSPISFGPFGIFKSSQLPNLRVFFAYQNLTTDSTFVEATLFHEGLHGETLKNDAALCSALNVPSENANCWDHSVDITCWIAAEVFLEQNLPGLPQWCPGDVKF